MDLFDKRLSARLNRDIDVRVTVINAEFEVYYPSREEPVAAERDVGGEAEVSQ